MKAITLWQPWASLVEVGAKRIETRSWPTQHRGWLAIHAGGKYTRQQHRLALREPFWAGLAAYQHKTLPLGAVVAICQLTACERMTEPLIAVVEEPERSFGDYQPGRWMWMLKGIIRLPEPIPCRGHQGLWDWDPPASVLELMR